MARESIDKISVRKKLTVRREPYWGAPLERGLFVGFRKLTVGGTWIARYRNGDRKQTYHSLGPDGEMDFDAAKAATQSWRKAIDADINSSGVDTVSDACRRYVADRLREKGAANAKDAEGRFERTVFHNEIGKIRLDRLRANHVKAWRSNLGLAPSSSNRTLATLKAALNFAVAERFIDAGKAIEWNSVKAKREAASRDLYLSQDQRRLLLEQMTGVARDFVHLLCLMGVRPAALAHAKVSDFDCSNATLTIRVDKAGAGRSVPLAGEAVRIFESYATKASSTDMPLIPYTDETAWNKERWKQPIKRAALAAGLSIQTCAYTLRHSAITDLVVGNLDLYTVAKLAGTSVVMIERYYGKFRKEHAARAIEDLSLYDLGAPD